MCVRIYICFFVKICQTNTMEDCHVADFKYFFIVIMEFQGISVFIYGTFLQAKMKLLEKFTEQSLMSVYSLVFPTFPNLINKMHNFIYCKFITLSKNNIRILSEKTGGKFGPIDPQNFIVFFSLVKILKI